MEGKENPREERFSIVVGGPFHSMLHRLNLVGEDALPSYKATFLLITIAWLPPALLVALQSVMTGTYSGWDYFTDWTIYTRYIVAIWAMTATERYADGRLILLTRHFREARLLPKESQQDFSNALTQADKRSSYVAAELVIVAIALVWSSITSYYLVEISVTNWSGTLIADDPALSWAGQYARFVSTPLFLFLVLLLILSVLAKSPRK